MVRRFRQNDSAAGYHAIGGSDDLLCQSNGSGYCESDLKPVTVHRFLGVQDETFRNVSVLPIPTSDKLTISNTAPIESVELFNLLGQRVLVKKAGFQNEMELDVSFLSSGTYLLNVIIDGKIGTFKVIKEETKSEKVVLS